MNLSEKKVLVVGLEKTGEALCAFLLHQGAQVKVSEKRNPEELGNKILSWEKKGITIEAGGHELHSFLEADLIIPSPGVPFLPVLKKARDRGVKIISEIELAHRFLRGKIVGITGSNGKSTTATLTSNILKDGGVKAFLAGNIQTPLISFVEQSLPDHVYVTELSSFQLKHIEQFKVNVSVILNISPDHLDWHKTFEDYYESKKNLIVNQGKNEIAILNRDDSLVWSLVKNAEFKIYAFSRKDRVARGCYLHKNSIILSEKQPRTLMKISEIPLKGTHNQENVMASALVGLIFGISLSSIRKSIKSFRGLEHRLEKVLSLGEIEFYNDSKATNVDAALKSIQSFDKKIVLIMGGRDKGGDFQKLKKPIKEKVKHLILMGEARGKIQKAFENAIPTNLASSLKEAVQLGFSVATPGEIILLAPACTSFDMFKNFEERGTVFKQEVFRLKEKTVRKRV